MNDGSHDHHNHDEHHPHHHGDNHDSHGAAEDEQALYEQFKRLRVADLAYEMMVGLVTVGYQKLGLTEHTRDLRDLDDAHLSIELLRASLRVVEQDAGRDQFKDLRATLAQMQLGYAEAVKAAARDAAGGEDEEARASKDAAAEEAPPAADEPVSGSD